MLESLGIRADVLFICIFVFIFVLIALVFALLAKVNRMSEAYNRFIKGANGRSLEEKFTSDIKKIDRMNEEVTFLRSKVTDLSEKRSSSMCKFAITRFDAFDANGGKLSFSLCLLDDNNDGFILTSMNNANGCYNYLKEVKAGESYTKLSDNEEMVLVDALNKRTKQTSIEID